MRYFGVLLLLVASAFGQVGGSSGLNGTPATAPAASVLNAPAPNISTSLYDKFYSTEPGVYAYWSMADFYPPADTAQDNSGEYGFPAGQYGLPTHLQSVAANFFVQDGETVDRIIYTNDFIQSDSLVINPNSGTIATWINTDAASPPLILPAISLRAQESTDRSNCPVSITYYGCSQIQLMRCLNVGTAPCNIGTPDNTLCFVAQWVNTSNAASYSTKCGYTVNTNHRVVVTWTAGTLTLYVDGGSVATSTYSGNLDNSAFFRQLFTNSGDVYGQQMTLGKIAVANQAWTTSQVTADYTPNLAAITPPANGVVVTSTQLGTIHKDVMGYADNGEDIQTSGQLTAMLKGLADAGVTAVRYANGWGGINADQADYLFPSTGHMTQCYGGVTGPVTPSKGGTNWGGLGDNIGTYIPAIQTLPQGPLDIAYTVNYGSNQACTAGGDPTINGANAITYLNAHAAHPKYVEIGNEQYGCGSAYDLHPNPYRDNCASGSGNRLSTYPTYFPAFYTAMKAVDPTIKIGVPMSFGGDSNYFYPILAQSAYFDAIVEHPYPIHTPITDGGTLYQERNAANSGVRPALLLTQTALLAAGKSPEAMFLTEWDAQAGGNLWSLQSMGVTTSLFVVTQIAEFMRAGAQLATWWAQGTPNTCDRYNFDSSVQTSYVWIDPTLESFRFVGGCGSGALVYTGSAGGGDDTPMGMVPGDLFPAGRGFQVLSQSGMIVEGEHMLQTYIDNSIPGVYAYGATHGSTYAVILINRETVAHTVPIKLPASTWNGAVQTSYGKAQYDNAINKNWQVPPVKTTYAAGTGNLSVVLPPLSANVVVLQ